jgi:SAM-dependent methyltransferase
MPVLPAGAAAMPFADASSDLVMACMSLPDTGDLGGAVSEIGRVLRPGGRLCLAVLHPFVSARNEDTMRTASFRFSRPCPEPRRRGGQVERDGLTMRFTGMHRPLSVCVLALAADGMMISALVEGGDGAIPWLLAARADKIAR